MASLMHAVDLVIGDWTLLAADDTYDSVGYQIVNGVAALCVAESEPAADADTYIVISEDEVRSFSIDLPAGYAVYGMALGRAASVRGYRVPSA